MEWLLSNLLPVFVIGLFALAASRWARLSPAWRSRLFWAGLVMMAVAVIGLVVVVYSPPGREDTEPDEITPGAERSAGLLTTLEAAWDSEASANWPVAETMASISEAAYLPPVEAQAKFEGLGFKTVGAFVNASMIGYVMAVDDAAVIVFRGTDDVPDWVANLDVRAVNTPHGRVHRGFYNSYQPLKPQISQLLALSKSKQVWITGHSLGGALAVICAYDLIEEQDVDVSGVITFGQPMVARGEMVDHLNSVLASKYAHVVNESDVVPRIPPGYRHCGSLVWFTDGTVQRSRRGVRRTGDARTEQPADAVEEEEAIEPLSRQEFEALQAQLRVEGSQPQFSPEGIPMAEGSSPLIRDHQMALYVEKVKSFLTAKK